MKNLSFVMDSNFNLHLTNKNEVYEFENLATNLVIETVVDSAMEYELHFKHNDDKYIKLLTKDEGSLSCELTSNILKSDGFYTIQIRGIKGDTRIISNPYRFMVNSFINTAYEPTPEEESIVTQILARITEIESDMEDLANIVDEKQDVLQSGVNIKTINSQSILGSGNITIQGGSGSNVTMIDNTEGGVDLTVDEITRTLAEQSDLDDLDEQLSEVEESVNDKVNVDNYGADPYVYFEYDGREEDYDDLYKTSLSAYGLYMNGEEMNGTKHVCSFDTRELSVQVGDYTTPNIQSFIRIGGTQIRLLDTGERQVTNVPISDLKQIPNIKNKQDKLVSGTNIKTVNGQSLLGSGNIVIQGGEGSDVSISDNPNGGVDITVDGTTKTLAKESDISNKAQFVRDGLVGNTIPLTDSEQVGIENWLGLSENYISFSNTRPFTPTSNYHPATKKYVDDNKVDKSKIWVGTQSEYEAITTKDPTVLYFVKES